MVIRKTTAACLAVCLWTQQADAFGFGLRPSASLALPQSSSRSFADAVSRIGGGNGGGGGGGAGARGMTMYSSFKKKGGKKKGKAGGGGKKTSGGGGGGSKGGDGGPPSPNVDTSRRVSAGGSGPVGS